MKDRLRGYTVNLLLFTVSLFVCYVILEVGLRLWLYGGLRWEFAHLPEIRRDTHPALGWKLLPDQTSTSVSLDYRVVIKTNSKGYRDQERSLEKAEGVFRILLLGDSHMEAAHVPWEAAFPHVLQWRLRDQNVEVVNVGIGGYGTVQQRLQLFEEGLRYEPDLVLLAFFAENDFHNNSRTLSKIMWRKDSIRYFGRPYVGIDESSGALEWIGPDAEAVKEYRETLAVALEKAKGYRWLERFTESVTEDTYKHVIRSLRQKIFSTGKDPNVHLGAYLSRFDPSLNRKADLTEEAYQAAWEEARTLTRRVIYDMAALARREGVAFAIFSVPSKLQVEPAYRDLVRKRYPQLDLDVDRPHRLLAQWAGDAAIAYLDLTPIFRETHVAGGHRLHYTIGDAHWNVAGHRLAAERVALWLRKEGLGPC